MKFVMSYSCGKDSTLALHKMIAEGHTPVGLLVMFNEGTERSFFHGADRPLLEGYSEALGIPLILRPTDGYDYHLSMEEGLRQARAMGAEFACFGDIDIEGNRAWSEERCKNVGIRAEFPLWHAGRRENTREVVSLGYKCLIKTVNKTLLPKALCGRMLDEDTLRIMADAGVDLCGENGEYHTLVVDGPIFRHPLRYQMGEVLEFEGSDYPVVDVLSLEREST